MGGGLMQLVAYGAQDIYLTGNPQITFFRIVYRRHTNFSLESIENTFSGAADFGKKVTSTISRNGDLVHKTYLQVTLPTVTVPAAAITGESNGFRWLNWLGHILVKTVELEIGGQRVDKHYSAWLHIWNELTQTAGHAAGYANMVGNSADLTSVTEVLNGDASKTVPSKTLYIPLQFWFCRNPGLALPLIALQYHEVKINVELAPLADCYWSGTKDAAGVWTTAMSTVVPGSLSSCSLWVDYCYLDTEERRRMAQVSHEYLIEQLQFTGDESTSSGNYKAKLNFNHPCKELVWVVQPNCHTEADALLGKQWFNFTDTLETSVDAVAFYKTVASGGLMPSVGANPVAKAKIQLNGHDRFAERDGDYFNLVQPYQHHTNVPSKGINVYSFALLPEEHQPSGSCNMSRIDNATLQLSLTPASVANNMSVRIKVFAVNYNVLRIMSGMGGLAYSN
jgi:hypothetical protein